MIAEITRGHIRLVLNGRAARIEGEAYLPGHGSPDLVAYRDTLRAWDDGSPLTTSDQNALLADLRQSAADRGISLEIE